MSQNVKVKLVTLGDGDSGKTALLTNLSRQEAPKGYIPTVFDNYAISFTLDGITIDLGLWDTAGAEQYNRLRPLAYPKSDVFLIVFSVASRGSYINAIKRYYPEIIEAMGSRAAIIFVGNHVQLRTNEQKSQQFVSKKEAQEQIEAIMKQKYMECNIKTRKGIKQILFTATRDALKKRQMNKIPKAKKNNCQLI